MIQAKFNSMDYLFYGSGIVELDLSGWNTSNVTSMIQMFYLLNMLQTNTMILCRPSSAEGNFPVSDGIISVGQNQLSHRLLF